MYSQKKKIFKIKYWILHFLELEFSIIWKERQIKYSKCINESNFHKDTFDNEQFPCSVQIVFL